MNVRFYSITVILLLVSFSVGASESANIMYGEPVEISPMGIDIPSYQSLSPIVITHNDNFTDFGFTGAGTSENPYNLDDVEIKDDNACIDIYNTSAFFTISNSFVSKLYIKGIGTYGVLFSNVSNGKMINCIFDNLYDGLNISSSKNISLVDCTFQYNTYSIRAHKTQNLTITDSHFYDSSKFLDEHECSNISLRHCVIRDCGGSNIFSPGLNVTFCTFENIGEGIYSFGANLSVSDSTFNDCNYGITGEFITYGHNITNNLFISCGYAVIMYGGHNSTIHNNTIRHSDNALYISGDSRDMVITNNTIYKNYSPISFGGLGNSGGPNLIVNNTIAWNDFSARNYANITHQWDDGVHGNLWSDYSGTGPYLIEGTKGDQDNYPTKFNDTDGNPTIDNPSDISFNEGEYTSLFLEWLPADQWPGNYTLLVDDEELVSNLKWVGGNLTFDVSNHVHGVFNYTIIVSDGEGNTATDTVIVTVTDVTPSIISGPSDFTMFEDSLDNHINWTPSDLHPISYEIYINGSEAESGPWDGGFIDYNIDDLTIGFYNITLVVTDDGALSVADSVFVTVVDVINPNLTPVGDLGFGVDSPAWAYWSVSDRNPANATAYLNGTDVYEEDWDGGAIMVHLGILTEGVYNLTLRVFDVHGNFATDTVFVTVIASATTTTSETSTTPTLTESLPFANATDFQQFVALVTIVMIAMGGMIAILILVNVMVYRRVRTGNP